MTETRLRCRAGFREPDLRSLEVKISFIKRKATIVKFLIFFELVVILWYGTTIQNYLQRTLISWPTGDISFESSNPSPDVRPSRRCVFDFF